MKQEQWDTILTPKRPFFRLNLREVWSYRDLLILFTKRDIAQLYKQTILGPLWFFLQPLLTTLVFTLFGSMAEIPTDGIPPLLFYLSGITFWNFFAECLTKTSTTFKDHQNIFGKVYFARLVVPLSVVLNNLIKLGIQLGLFVVLYIFYTVKGSPIHMNEMALFFPLLVLTTAGIGLGCGLIITSLTTKYRDLSFLVTFGVQLLMFLTPVLIPLSEVPEEYQLFALLNPMTGVLETFKYGFLGGTSFSWFYVAYSFGSMLFLMLAGILVFNKTEQNFMDVI